MPLNTQPLSLTRRIVAVCVLLGILAGSLGLARALSNHRRAHFERAVYQDGVKIVLHASPDFQVTHYDYGNNPDEWQVELPSGVCKMTRTDGLAKWIQARTDSEKSTLLMLAVASEHGLRLEFDEEPLWLGPGKAQADAFIGLRPGKKDVFAYGCSAVVHGHCIALLLVNDKNPIREDDIDVFRKMCERAEITVDGKPYPSTPPATGQGREKL